MINELLEKIKRPLTIEYCTDYLRKKGIATLSYDETIVRFKLYDLNFDLSYEQERLVLRTSFLLGDKLDYECMLRAINKVNLERWIVKTYIDSQIVKNKDESETEERSITFSFESFCLSRAAFCKLYEFAIYALNDCIEFHKQCYNQFLEQKNSSLEKSTNKIGFNCHPETETTEHQPKERKQNHRIGFIQ